MGAEENKSKTTPCDIIEQLESAVSELSGDLIAFAQEYGPQLSSGHLPVDALEKYDAIREHFCRIAASVVAIERSICYGPSEVS